MKEIVNRLYTFNISTDDQEFRDRVDRCARIADRWDRSQIDAQILKKLSENL